MQSGVQAIATAYGDYAKKSFEDTESLVEQLSGVKSLDKALEAQTEYARSAYETFVAESRRSPASTPISPSDRQAVRGPGCEVHACRALILYQREVRKDKSPAATAGLFHVPGRVYLATRSLEICVRMVLKASDVWLALVIIGKRHRGSRNPSAPAIPGPCC